jgi:FAD/FMN-containing dehydrogenase
VRPKSAEDVAAALKVLRETDCTEFAVKGGGHNANAGFNNIEDGVTIDMHDMSKVELEHGHEVVRVGAGSLWQGVYDEVEKQNRSVLGGRIGVVGVAGFTTGGKMDRISYFQYRLTPNLGGVSYFSPERGWSCDSVVNFQVVLASGEIVNANATSRSDLYAALKGGQSNFGIVTRFDLKTFPHGPIWGGRTVYAPTADTALLSAFSDFKSSDAYDPYAAGWVTIRYNHTAAQITPVSIMWYTEPKSKPGALKGILDVKPQVMSSLVEAPPSEHARNASRMVTAAAKR